MNSLPRLSRAFLILMLALLSGCANVPRSVELSRQQIESALARRFPYEARAGDLFSVKADVPRLTLQPGDNRLRLDFAIDAMDRIVRNSVHGDLALSFGLRWEPSDSSIRLADVRVERIELQGLAERWRAQLQPLVTLAVEQLLDGAVLHTFSAEDMARARGWTPGEIRVTSGGVRIALLPPVQ